MNGLFNKIQKGTYPKIDKKLSKDMSLLISMLLKVNPDHRPNCEELLNMNMIRQRAKNITPHIYQRIVEKYSDKAQKD